MNVSIKKFGLGASVLRKEDQSLLIGKGQFTDDRTLPGQLFGYVVRSPYAHAEFEILSTEDAKSAPGVKLVLTAADLADLGPVKCKIPVTQPDGTTQEMRHTPVLSQGRARYAGDAVAFVVAETQDQAEDAAELIEIDWDVKDAIVDPNAALEPDAPQVWPELGSNRAYLFQKGDRSGVDAALLKADKVIELSVVNNRLIANFLEPRSAIADWNGDEQHWTLYCGSQGVHSLRNSLAADVFGVSPDQIRVVTGDVGGGFGTKAINYREYPLVMEASRRLNAPVKWLSSRMEHFAADAAGRDSVAHLKAAVSSDGRVEALKIKVLANMGAYLSQFGPMIPTMTGLMRTGVYDIQTTDFEIEAVYTHCTPTDAYRGAGRPEAAYFIERLMDAIAYELGMSPVDVRRKNFIRPEQMPYQTPGGPLYDNGEFDGHLQEAMKNADWDGFEQRAAEAKTRGRIRGIGLSTYVEICAFPGSEAAHLQLNQDGTVTLFIGTQTNGQGHATAYSQFVAEKLGIPFDQIIVRQGDTNELAKGGGTGGSRSIPLGGVSVIAASENLADKIKDMAADELEAAAADIELVDGVARVAGTDRQVSFADIAKAAPSPEAVLAVADIKQEQATFPNGTHVVEVEIDPETGTTEIVNYQIVDDFGVTVNPVLLLGQVHGGAAQGIGQALQEGTTYSADGQLLSASFMDYTMPRADTMPNFKFDTRHVASTHNALGIKGAGEAATIGSTPAVMNAVINALHREYGIKALDMPATPQKIWRAIQDAA
ncbi:xanthine dehydrogenase family protein molybdopterin-binding subunit [Rhizobium sp. L1K21]|uniref:xanthine dehydrogenase family protein molybdopterin-binding subunit n=1 Tax=Rhizobium sp. L1K21 TaxID=2954933 RepID=UPI0020921883|nr:xanthine dehydrogenase family protein molybdopterin-binding subunit [Rhizobium sp. L1K21]MCO6186663.1 xanthine dehydrogenase family protein molybdopterin-binding subunit [Rhizobium sp. L1K21]